MYPKFGYFWAKLYAKFMIQYNPKLWLKHIFNVAKSDTLYRLWPQMIFMALISLLITYLELKYIGEYNFLKDTGVIYSLIGFVLSLLLVFRTNTAYDRWWEGRRKWGELLNNSRNLAIKLKVAGLTSSDVDFFERMIHNFSIALKEHLRQGVNLNELNLTDEEKTKLTNYEHLPNAIVLLMYERLSAAKKDGYINEIEFQTIDVNLNELLNISGACERIRNTPIPYSYSLFLKKFIFIYVSTVPIAFVATLGYGTVLMAVFVFYVLVSMEILAEEIEDPFGTDDNDLPLDEICSRIQENLKEINKK
jgi:ion channel-forming bestrophin family protein